MKHETEIVLDNAHELLELRWCERAVRDAFEKAQRLLVLEKRQIVPAPQVTVEPRGHRRFTAELVAISRAASECRRDDRVDHARVEGVTGHADAAGREHV